VKVRTFWQRYEAIVVFLFFVGLTAVAAWNVLAHLNTAIIGFDNDVYINPWADWWTLKAITEPQTTLWHTDLLYFPIGADLTYHSFSHLNTAVSLLLRPFLGAIPAYNLTILFNYVLIGLSMYYMAKYFTHSAVAGLLAGIVFAFNTHSIYQSAHPVLVSIWCFPLVTLFFSRAVRENSLRLAAVAAFFVFLGAATSTVLIILMVFWLALLILFMMFSSQFPRPPWRVVLTFGLLSAVFVLPLVLPQLKDAILNRDESFLVNPQYSIRTDTLSIFIPQWRTWLMRRMYLGIIPIFLALVALVRQFRPALLWILLTVIAYLFAIGPVPTANGHSLGILLPWTLPVALVLRNMYRMMILMALGWSMVVAYGWLGFRDLLTRGQRSWQWVAALVLGALIFVDYTAVPFPITPIVVSPFYTEILPQIPDDVALAIVPTGRQEDKRYLFYQTYHGHPMTNGVISRADMSVFRFIAGNPLLRAGAVDFVPEKAPPSNPRLALQALAAANVGYFIIDKTLMEDIRPWQASFAALEPVYEDDLVVVYATSDAFAR